MHFTSAAVFALVSLSLASGCGRTASRVIGKSQRQVLEVENLDAFIGVSFDRRDGATVKDVTFKATDGYVYTREFVDASPFEGVIRWVPYGQGGDVVRSRGISRWTGGVVNMELPDDCAQVLGVDVGYGGEDERVKNVTCRTAENRIIAKEYREGMIDRHFEGWLEIVADK